MAESLLRYNLYVDCIPTQGMPQLTDAEVNNILSSALNSRALQQHQMDATALLHEINVDYMRCLNKIIFDLRLFGSDTLAHVAASLTLPAAPPRRAPYSPSTFRRALFTH